MDCIICLSTTKRSFFRKAVERVNSPLVFCHNDLQCGNILLREDADSLNSVDDSIVVIDYEFCRFNALLSLSNADSNY